MVGLWVCVGVCVCGGAGEGGHGGVTRFGSNIGGNHGGDQLMIIVCPFRRGEDYYIHLLLFISFFSPVNFAPANKMNCVCVRTRKHLFIEQSKWKV